MNDIVGLAIDSVNQCKVSFCKYISANDAGATGGHQAGIYIPKNSLKILFEQPGIKGGNLERFVNISWPDGTTTISRFVYYGSGSRNEYRITQLNKELPFKSLFILSQIDLDSYKAFILNEDDANNFLNEMSLTKNDTNQLILPNLLNTKLIKTSNNTENDKVTKIKKITEGTYKIRPAGRHILTIGKDLIKDNYAAIVELVKNAYDADATKVDIVFTTLNTEDSLDKIRIVIKDNGHGMDFDTVVNKWMVPSTKDKLLRKISPKGRTMQGRKGIGRYACSILGNELLLETCSEENENTTLFIDWNEFDKNDYLEDVPVLIENFTTHETSKTILEITGDNQALKSWTKSEIEILILELKKLIAPTQELSIPDVFDIKLEFKTFPVVKYENCIIEIQPFPILDLFDYRISGKISEDGIANLKYENNSTIGIIPEFYEFNIHLGDNEKYCGNVLLDLRVYDRESESIQNLIDRGLTDPNTDKHLGKNDTRKLLDDLSGIGIYRNGFRIRPYGDPGYDWLLLDKVRVQNPSFRIGSNQVIGYIGIQAEELSNLDEKSARDGLKENNHFFGLLKIVRQCLSRLEENRFSFRLKTGKGRSKDKTHELVESLYNFTSLKSEINKEFEYTSIPKEIQSKIANLIDQKEIENNYIADQLKKKIAEYQGQITLGKIVNVILHEGRKPFMYYTNNIPLLKSESESLKEKFDESILSSIIRKIDDIKLQSEILVDLFNKIDPLAAKRRDNKSIFNIIDSIETVRKVFEKEFEFNNISFTVNYSKELKFNGWPKDFYITFTNLIENSIYWLTEFNIKERNIRIDIKDIDNSFRIDYFDNGPGIEVKFIEDNLIFEPGFTTKSMGTGLGLAIAGEAMERNGCILKAEEIETGVHFIIETNIEKWNI